MYTEGETAVRRVKGRGASTYHRTEKEIDQMRMDEEKESVPNSTLPAEQEVRIFSAFSTVDTSENVQDERLPDDVIDVQTIFDWTPFGAEIIREEEAKNGRPQSKSYCDLSTTKRGEIYNDLYRQKND